MPLLIDGYNLLNATGIVGSRAGPPSLGRSRLALLNFLAASIDPHDIPHTTVVFDAHDAPPGLPRVVQHGGIVVRFAAKYETADELIAELIRADSAPRRLVVVSSDHEIQRAARRRRAKAVDSDAWYADLIRVRRERAETADDAPARPAVRLLQEDVSYWLRQFGGESQLTTLLLGQQAKAMSEALPEPSTTANREEPVLDNPFPPGYGEDLLRDL
jgi:predicted RNA-binding protein with PIN domain